MAITGPDVSRHQGEVNWRAVKDAGHTFAFCKATDGVRYDWTGFFLRQFAEMKAVGLVPGAYHWLQPGRGTQQADYFVDVVRDFTGVLAVVDVEKNPNGTFAKIGDLRAFATQFAYRTGGHPLIVYTGKWFWVDYLKDPYGADIGPLWHSEYEPNIAEVEDGPEQDRYGGWNACTFWQFTSNDIGLGLDVPGIATRCDLNIFYGSLSDLYALARYPIKKDAPPGEDDDDMFVMYHPNHTFWLITASTAVEISADAYQRFLNSQFKAVAPLAADAQAIIDSLEVVA